MIINKRRIYKSAFYDMFIAIPEATASPNIEGLWVATHLISIAKFLLNCFFFVFFLHGPEKYNNRVALHWNENVVMLTKFSWLAAMKFV